MSKAYALATALAGAVLFGGSLHAAPSNTYQGADKGDWNTAGNWSAASVPNGADGTYYDVANSSANTAVHSASLGTGGIDLINSLNFTGTGGLTLSGGILAGSQASDASIFSVAGPLLLSGGTLRNFTLMNSDSATFNSSTANTLDNVSLSSGLNLGGPTITSPSSYLNITGAFAYNSGAAFVLNSRSTLNFANSQTLDNATLTLYESYLKIAGGTTLTLGPNLSVQGFSGSISSGDTAGASIANNANLSLSGASLNQFTLGGSKDDLVNNNLIAMDGQYGTLFLLSSGLSTDRALTNNGTIEADNDATIYLGPGQYTKLGTINALGNGSRIFLGGGVLSLGNGESLTTSGASLFLLNTTLDNTGKTFDPTINIAGTHHFVLDTGTIEGGMIGHSDQIQFASGSQNTFQDVALDGGLNISGTLLHIRGTFAYGVGATLSAGGGRLQFGTDCTLDGSTLTLGGGYLGVDTAHTVTFGPNLTFLSGTVDGSGAVVNNANLTSSGGGYAFNASSFTNNAKIVASAGNLAIGTNSSHTTLTNNGTLAAIGGSSVFQPDTYAKVGILQSSGNGLISLRGGTMRLGDGDQLLADTGGKFELQTTLDNTNQTLDIGTIGTTGSFVNGGTIKGGTLLNSDQLTYEEGINGTLQDVTLAGADGLNIGQSQTAAIAGTFAYGNGSHFTFGTFGRLTFNTDFTLANANVALGDSNGSFGFLTSGGGHTLTLDASTIFTGAAGQIDGDSVINNSIITSDAGQGDYWTLRGSTLVNNGIAQVTAAKSFLNVGDAYTNSLINNGTIQAINGGTAYVGDGYSFTNNGTVKIGTGSQIRINGGMSQAVGKTQVDGNLLLLPFMNNQTVTIQGGTLTGSGTIQGDVEIDGGVFSPGDSPGTMTIVHNASSQPGNGNYTQGASGTFLEELGGADAGEFDVLNVGSAATLDGALDISLVNGFAPTLGQTFTFLNYGSLSGAFNSVASLDSGYGYSVAYGANSAALTVTSIAAAPEPSTIKSLLLGLLGLTGLGIMARCRKTTRTD